MKYVCILQIEELNLDNTRGSTEIEGLTEEYTALHTLSLIKIGLTSLKGFPKLPNLTKVKSLKQELQCSFANWLFLRMPVKTILCSNGPDHIFLGIFLALYPLTKSVGNIQVKNHYANVANTFGQA